MLLNRRRIDKWARWAALGLAIVFAVSFVFLGVGSGMPGLDFSQLWTGGNSNAAPEAKTPDQLITDYQAQLAQNPKDYNALVGIAQQYQVLDQPEAAAPYLAKALEQQPDNVQLNQQLAAVYMNPSVQDYQAAVKVLNKLTELQTNNADAFLQLGVAQRNLGNNEAAILAWNRYLELQPDGETAKTVQTEIDQLKAQTAGGDQGATQNGAQDASGGTTATTAK